jgi:hypothetical protein
MWSPALTWPIIASVTAAIPVAVARAASAPSNSAMRCSNIDTVGLAKRDAVAGVFAAQPGLAARIVVVAE